MFTIGDFATLGRVSVRMLRHYDAIGLLRPARVDASSGYRYYESVQLQRLNRLLALKDLGFTLGEVATILDAEPDPAELRGMLRLRRSQVAAQLAADRDRLTRIEARLRMIEREGTMSTSSVTVKAVHPVRIAAVSGSAASTDNEDVGPVVQALFQRLFASLGPAGVAPAGPVTASYRPLAEGESLSVTAGCPVEGEVVVAGLEVIELPAVPEAACYVHVGTMEEIGEGYQALATWIEEHGYLTDGSAREIYLVSHPEPQERWRTELQMPITRSA